VELKPKLDLLRDYGKSKRHLDKGPFLNMKVHALPFKPVNMVSSEIKKLELKLAPVRFSKKKGKAPPSRKSSFTEPRKALSLFKLFIGFYK
jgi:hypothetical protein